MTSELAKQVAAAVVLMTVGLITFAAAVLLWRVPYDVLVNEWLTPLGIGAGIVVIVANWISWKLLAGTKRTNSTIASVLELAKQAGAAEELRGRIREVERKQDDDN